MKLPGPPFRRGEGPSAEPSTPCRERPMEPLINNGHRVLYRDLMIFQLKLFLDGLKGFFLMQLSIGAALIDLLFGRQGRPLLFYRVLRLSERFDLWLNLYGPAANAEKTADGLFGASAAGSNSLLGKLEQLVRNKIETARPPRHAKAA